MRKFNLRQISSYITPVIAILTVFIIVVLLTWKVTENEIELSSMQTSNYFASSIDTQLTSIESYSYDLLNLQPVTALSALERSQSSNYTTLVMANQLSHHLWAVVNSADYFDSVAYYFSNLDKVVSQRGYLDMDQYFFLENLQLHQDTDGIEQRFQAVFGCQQTAYYNVYNPYSDTVECYYSRRIPFNATPEACDLTLVIRIDSAAIQSLLQEIARDMDLRYIALITQEGSVFAQAGDPEQDISVLLAEGSDALVSGSSLWGMQLYFIHARETSQSFLKTVLVILCAGLLLAAVLGVLLALRGHQQTASRIQEAKNQLGASDAVSLEEAIIRHLDSSHTRNMENMQKLMEQQVLVNSAFLRDLLGHGDSSDSALENLCSIYNVEMDYPYFSLFAISCKTKSTADMHYQTIQQYLSAENPDAITAFWTDVDMIQFFLCGYDDPQTAKRAIAQLQGDLSELLASRIYGNSCTLRSLSEVIEEFRTLYQVIEGRRFTPFYRSIFEMEDIYGQLRDCLISSDQAKLARLLPTVQQQLQQETLTNNQRCQRYAFLADLYHAPELSTSTPILDEMFQDLRWETWMQYLRSFLDNPAAEFASQQEQRQVAAQVARIIADEYANPQMSLAMLASRLGVTQSYLSRSFKQKYGENISHYLSRTRIEHAKSLIKNGSDNLNAIALSVGFLSDMNLIRVFKRLENETPGNFRKKHKAE